MANIEDQIKAAEDLRCESLVARKFDQLNLLFSDDLIHIHSIGVRQGKQELIEYVRNKVEFISVERSELKVRLLSDDVALMTGFMTNEMRPTGGGDMVIATSHVSQIWFRSGDRWQLTLFHATRAASR